MHYAVEVAGRIRQVHVERGDGRFVVTVDGRHHVVDAQRVDAHTVSLLMVGRPESRPDPSASEGKASDTSAICVGDSYAVTLATDPVTKQLVVGVGAVTVPVALNGRRRSDRKDEAAHGAGPQRIVAPMPGKIVKVLVNKGDPVRARQPLVVIEAMKMENELRAAEAGAVAELHVQEGQSVDAGTLVALVGPA
jgi:biotin carboxyl carrier protein